MPVYFKTVFTVEVLSEDQPIDENISLAKIEYEITDGDAVGIIKRTVVKELSAKEVAKELQRLGSSPDFFMLDDNGDNVDGFD